MKAWLDLLPGWPPDEVEALARAGHRVVVEQRPRGIRSPVAVRVGDRLPEDLRPGDVALRTMPLEGGDLEAFAAECRLHRVDGWAVVHTPGQVAAARRAGIGAWLRGQEAGGRVAEYTALVLVRAAWGGRFVVEGLGRRAMAAALAIGADGVVLGAHLWATRRSPVHEAHRAALAGAADGRDTALLGIEVDRPVRVLVRGSLEARTLGEAGKKGDPEAFERVVAAGLAGWAGRADALVPAPQCVAEAAAVAGRDAVDAAREILEDVRGRRDAVRVGHPLAGRDPVGTGTPIVQGPMANVAEKPDLAVAVEAAGAMPFAALGALDPGRAEQVAKSFAAALGGPWGLGIIGFDVMPHRDAHLAIARALRPAAVTLAGGTAELALGLQADGLEPWLHTPSGALAARAFQKGVRAVILEGHECGGHVGALTSAGLWEEGLAAAEQAEPGSLVVLAGGIGDAPSAAFAAAMGAVADGRGVRVALQAGTAFLLTEEALAGGQVTPAYHAAALAAGRTELVGATVGLPLRCVPNAFVTEARADERRWLADGVPAGERRQRVEHHNLGRTRIAAKGIERNPAWGATSGVARYREVERERQDAEGAFTLGQGTVVTDRIGTVEEVVRALGEDARALLDRAGVADRWGPARGVAGDPTEGRAIDSAPQRLRRRGEVEVRASAPIAVVGLGCIVPGALDVGALWDLLIRGESAIDDIPRDRWDPADYWDPQAGSTGPIKTYSRVAGAVRGFAFDPLRYKIPPRVAGTMDPAQRIALAAAEQAVKDAGWLGDRVDKRRAAVILGNSMGGEFAKRLSIRVRFRDVVAAMREEGALDGLGEADRVALIDRVEARLAERLPPIDVDTMAGLLSNVIAGRVTMWLDWMGGNMTVDAACAASLAAVSVAVEWLRVGRCDAVLTGGVDTDLSPESFVAFARTEALSTAGSRPFQAAADGFVMGEGCGVLALKRLDDALRDGDAVWAVIRGIGQSSDGRGRGITAPRDAGQKLAVERAYAEAGVRPVDIGLVEAHGTGTHVGDRTEVGVLRDVFAGAVRPTWLGSIKSNLGHLKGAAGSAGLLKAILSVATGIVPPTINAGPVSADLGLGESPLRLPKKPTIFPDHGPRRAAISAFGFGGTNFHVVVEEPPPEARRPEAVAALVARAWDFVEPDAIAAAWPLPGEDRAVEPSGPVEPWLLVPGQGAQRDGAVASVRRFPAGAAALDALEAVLPAVAAGIGLQAKTFVDLEGGAPDTRRLHLLLYGLAVAWAAVWKHAGAPLAGVVGHSLGEYGALVAAGRLDPVDGLRLVAVRGAALHATPPGAMLAVAMPEAEAGARAGDAGLALAAVNGPAACVLAGSVEAVEALAHELAGEGISATRLAVDRAFHSPLVAPAAAALADALAEVRFHPGLPVISGATALPFGDDPAADLVAGLLRPVRFADALAAAAPRLVVEVGPGRTLSRLAEVSLRGVRAVPLDPRAGEDGPWRAADDLARAGRPELRAALGPAPAPVAAPAVVVPQGEDPIRDAVVGAIHDVTGYPVEYIAEGVDLEGDLGVDSIRKMEVLGLLQERLGFAAVESDYAGLSRARLEDLVAYAKGRVGAADEAPAPVLRGPVRTWLEVGVPMHDAPSDPASVLPPAGTWAHVDDRILWRVAATGADAGRIRAVLADGLAIARDLVPFARIVVVGPQGDPGAAAAAAFARSLAKERGGTAREIRVDKAGDARVAAEALAEDRPARIRVCPNGTECMALVPADLDAPDLPERPVVLATGGSRGIVLPCLAALAPRRPRVVLIGRTAPDGTTTDRLDALREDGVEITWMRCDVTEEADVRAAVAAVRALHGRIDVVIHAAGALADGPAATLSDEDLARVVGPKVDGTLHLAAATADDAPALWVAFSSITAYYGNAGQSAYAGANAALAALPHPTARRSVALAWTAWREVGMAASRGVLALLAARGITALEPADGGRAFAEALGGTGTIVVSSDPPALAPLPWPLAEVISLAPGRRGRFLVTLDPDEPALADHVVGGRPLVPAALWVSALVAAGRLVRPAPGLWGACAFEVTAPTFVEVERDAEIVIDGDDARVIVRGTVVASARVAPDEAIALEAPPLPLDAPRPASPLYRPDLLFHGPAWQVLDRVEGDGNGGVSADVAPVNGLGLATAVDAAHQILSAWAGRATGWLGLPVGASRWIVADSATGPIRMHSHARVDDDGVTGEIIATDASGRVVLVGRDVHLRRAARWPDDAPDVLGGPA